MNLARVTSLYTVSLGLGVHYPHTHTRARKNVWARLLLHADFAFVLCVGKRGRNDDSQVNMNDAAHISTSNQAENKKSKGKQLSAEEQEEIVTNLKSLSSINGLEVTFCPPH